MRRRRVRRPHGQQVRVLGVVVVRPDPSVGVAHHLAIDENVILLTLSLHHY